MLLTHLQDVYTRMFQMGLVIRYCWNPGLWLLNHCRLPCWSESFKVKEEVVQYEVSDADIKFFLIFKNDFYKAYQKTF